MTSVTAPSGVRCGVSLVPEPASVPAAGGSGHVVVNTNRDCAWSASSSASWLSLSQTNGQGEARVGYSAAANPDPVTRTAAVVLNDQRTEIAQGAGECRFELGRATTSFTRGGGPGSIEVGASSGLCEWQASADVEWIAVRTPSGRGSGRADFDVAPTDGPPRTGTITIAGLRMGITQAEGCTYAIAPASQQVAATGGSGTIAVTSGAGCPWTATAGAAWVTITSGASGSGDGMVGFSVAPTDGPPRSSTIAVAGETFTVSQSGGCALSVSPTTVTVESSGGSRTIAVSGAGGCAWSAQSHDGWISFAGGTSGAGNGSVTIVAAATDGPGRTGTVTVAGHTVTVTQSAGCSFSVDPASRTVPAGGGPTGFNVSSPPGCSWTASSSVDWLHLEGGGAGTGDGVVSVTAQPNTGAARSGTLTIAGHTVTVQQDAAAVACTYAVEPQSMTVGGGGSKRQVTVTTPEGCDWTAVSHVDWIVIESGASGTGPGVVTFEVGRNVQSPARTGTLTVAGHTVRIDQN